jgi:hypothetical protein
MVAGGALTQGWKGGGSIHGPRISSDWTDNKLDMDPTLGFEKKST